MPSKLGIKMANSFKNHRIESGLTQQQLADKTGVSLKTIQFWELHGTKSAKASSLANAADVMGTTITEILC